MDEEQVIHDERQRGEAEFDQFADAVGEHGVEADGRAAVAEEVGEVGEVDDVGGGAGGEGAEDGVLDEVHGEHGGEEADDHERDIGR